MSLLDREDVPAPKSRASTRPTDSPRVAASSATPAPTTPPPTTSTWSSAPASAASAADLESGSSRAVSAPTALTSGTLAPTDQRFGGALEVTTTSTRWNSLRSE